MTSGAAGSRTAIKALDSARELSAEEEGAITDDADGLRVWVGDDGFDLEPAEA